MRKILLITLIAIAGSFVQAQTGTLDPSYGNNGIIITEADSSGKFQPEGVERGFELSDGKLVTVVSKEGKIFLTKRLANGTRDASFAFGGFSRIVTMNFADAAMQPDGKVVVIGNSDGNPDGKNCMLVRYNQDGSLDASFGNTGTIRTNLDLPGCALRSIVINSSSKIILGGSVIIDDIEHFLLAGFDAFGKPDPGFGKNGVATHSFDNSPCSLSSMKLQSDGKIVVAGSAVSADFESKMIVARFMPDGNLDSLFNSTGFNLTKEDAYTRVVLAIAPGGELYTAMQYFSAEEFVTGVSITRFKNDGTSDLAYNSGSATRTVMKTDFWVYSTDVTDILIQPDGKLLATGEWAESTPFALTHWLCRLNLNGQLDSSFGTDGVAVPEKLGWIETKQFITMLANGMILTGGYLWSHPYDDAANYSSLYRLNTNGTLSQSFGKEGRVIDYVPTSMYTFRSAMLQSDGKLLATSGQRVGYSDEGHAEDSSSYITRYTTAGSPDNSFAPNGKIQSAGPDDEIGLLMPDGRLYNPEYTYNNDDPSIALHILKRYNLNITPDNSFGSNASCLLKYDDPLTRVVIYPGPKILVAESAERMLSITRFNENGSSDASFGSSGVTAIDFSMVDDYVYPRSIAISGDGKIIIGCQRVVSTGSGTLSDILVIRLNSNGSIDKSFGTEGRILIDQFLAEDLGKMAVQSDGKIIFSRYTISASGTGLNFISRLNVNGSPDTTFGNKQVPGSMFILQPDDRIICTGDRVNTQNNVDLVLTRLTANGSTDSSFGTNGAVLTSLSMLAIYPTELLYSPNNGLYFVGSALNNLGNFVGLIARFRMNAAPVNVTCREDKIVVADKGLCTAKVNNLDPTLIGVDMSTIKYQLSGATIGAGTGSVSGKDFNKGVTTVTYTLQSDVTKTCSFTVTVKDKEAPVITGLLVNPTTLPQPNHTMMEVTLSYEASDNCGAPRIALGVSSNEPISSGDDGDQFPDWQIIDALHVRLRAERLNGGNGRAYTIRVFATDLSGNQTVKSVVVTVPKNNPVPVSELNVQVAPNPTSSYFRISLSSPSEEKVNLCIVNVKGVVVAASNNVSPQQVIMIGDKLSPGIYFLEATQGKTKKTVKLVKQN